MGTVNVTEYQFAIGDKAGHGVQAGLHDGHETVQNKAYDAATSLVLQSTTHFVRLNSDAVLYLAVDKTATASSTKVNADTIEFFGVKPGATLSFYDGTT